MKLTIHNVIVAPGNRCHRCPSTFGQDVRVFSGGSVEVNTVIKIRIRCITRTKCTDSAKTDEQNVFLDLNDHANVQGNVNSHKVYQRYISELIQTQNKFA